MGKYKISKVVGGPRGMSQKAKLSLVEQALRQGAKEKKEEIKLERGRKFRVGERVTYCHPLTGESYKGVIINIQKGVYHFMADDHAFSGGWARTQDLKKIRGQKISNKIRVDYGYPPLEK